MSFNKWKVILIVIVAFVLFDCSHAYGQGSLPTGWSDQDIGQVGVAGSASYSSGVFTVQGAGWGAANLPSDGLHFVYQGLSGDGTIIARLVSTNSYYAQAGVMIRETLDADATSMFVVDNDSTIEGLYRTTTGANSNYLYGPGGIALPYWLKLVRAGSSFSAYASPDGVNWQQVGTSQTINMAQNVYIGFAVSSATTSSTATATFDNVSLSTTTNPAPQITSVSATTGSVGSQVVISGSGFGNPQGNSVVLLNGTAVTINSWSGTSITITIPAGATSGYLVVSVAPSMNDSNPVEFTVTANPLPTGWLDQDIGQVGVAGSASYSSGVFTVQGAGWGAANLPSDGLHFVYQGLSGDGTIIARLVSTNSYYAQAGVMIRETLDADATSMFVVDNDSTIEGLYRTTTGANSNYLYGPGGIALPYWLKLVRAGSSFSAYASPDGVNWQQVGTSQTINMAQNVYIGFAVSSATTSSTATATFDNVSLSTTTNPAPQITSVSATTGSVDSQVVISGSGFGNPQGNSVVLLNGTAVTINSWSGTSITITIPAGATSGYLVVSVAPSMNDSNPVEFTVTANPLPTGWLDQDIGQVGIVGSASYLNGEFTLQGAGGALATTPDALHFAYQTLTGDGTVIARVVSTTSFYALAGVMIRATLDPNAETMFVTYNASAIYDVYRMTTGSTAGYAYGPQGVSLPYWVKLVRAGSSLTGYASPDGVSWTIVAGPMPIDMAQTVYAGLAASSGTTASTATAIFDNVSVSTTTTPAPEITSVSATTGSVGSQVVISGSGFGASQGNSVVLLNDALVNINSWSNASISITIPTGATSGLLAVLVGPSLISSNSVFFAVTSEPLLSGWLDQDVGTVGIAGSASYTNGGFTVQGAGTSFAGTADGFHFVYQSLTTDGAIVARVVSQTANSQAGVLIRETLDAGSAEALTYISSNTAYTGYRTFEGGLLQQGGGQGASLPYWVEVSRSANAFSCYVSSDGQTWVQIGTTQTFTTPETLYVGLGVSSGNTSSLATATFDNVAVTQGASLSNPIVTGLSPNTGAPGVTVSISGSGFGASQGSSTVLFNGATATVSSWSDSQIVAGVPDDVTTGPVSVTVGNITSQGPTFTVAFAVQLTDSLGHQTSYNSSVAGGQWSLTSAQGSGCSTCTTRGTINNQYDANGNLLWTTDAVGNATINQYDSYGNLTLRYAPLGPSAAATTQYTYNSFGEIRSMTDPLGNTTTYSYDWHGNLLSVTSPAPGGGAGASVTQFAYNSLGELTQITDPLGHVTTLTYTPAGFIATITDPQSNVTSYTYDAHGNRTSVTDALQNQTTFAYDAGDRLTTITYPGGATSSFTYDYRGRRITATDQNGKTTTYAYDDANRLTSITDAARNATQYSYDTESNLLSITDANSHTTDFSYDAFGRVTQTTFPSNYFETYAYDADNNLTSKTDRKGQTIQYVYDALNRLTQKTYPDSTTVEYVYDLVGKIQQVTDPTGTYSFAYDNMGRLIGTTTQYSFLPNQTFTNSYTYDAASNRTGYTTPDASTNSYSYDSLNRLTGLSNSWAGSFGFTYDALSRRTQMTRPNGVGTNYSYDNLSHLLSVLHQVGGSTIDGASYTVDAAGNRTSKTDDRAAVTSNYTYDPLYQLMQVTQATDTTESYSYDPVGNRLSSLNVSSYTNNLSNELTATSTESYAYDYNGNTTSKTVSGNTTSYSWDYENRLASVTLPSSGGTVSFKYDPFGRRIYKQSPNTTNIFAYDGANLVETANGTGSEVAHYAQGLSIDEPLATQRGTTTAYYEADGLGSITSLTATNGSIAKSYTYDSFGNTTNSTGSLTNFFRYTAREFDTETNLYFYRARYYDPSTGKFLSEDPVEFTGGIDFYRYVRNNPASLTDPLGLQEHTPSQPCFAHSLDECVPPPPPKPPHPPAGWDNTGGFGGTLGPIRPPAGVGGCPTNGDNHCDDIYEADLAVCWSIPNKQQQAVCARQAAIRYGECLAKGEPSSPLSWW